MALGLVRVEVRVNGPGSGREAAVRALVKPDSLNPTADELEQ